MTRDQIDAMWNKALQQAIKDGEQFTRYHFAALVAAAERNSWPAEMEAMERQVNILTDALAQAKAEEREACADKTGEFARKWWSIHCASNKHMETTRKAHDDFCALQAAIRARGQS